MSVVLIDLIVSVLLFKMANVGAGHVDDFHRIDVIKQEEACLTAGGTCVIAEDCPDLHDEMGLCSKQQALGIECCKGMSVKETRCEKRGGTCMEESSICPSSKLYNAADCGENYVCCINSVDSTLSM